MPDRRPRRRFEPQFKADVVAAVERGDMTVPQVARQFDVGVTAVRSWVKKAHQGHTEVETVEEATGWTPVTIDAEEDQMSEQDLGEVYRLRALNRQLASDVETLKRALVIFAKETQDV